MDHRKLEPLRTKLLRKLSHAAMLIALLYALAAPAAPASASHRNTTTSGFTTYTSTSTPTSSPTWPISQNWDDDNYDRVSRANWGS